MTRTILALVLTLGACAVCVEPPPPANQTFCERVYALGCDIDCEGGEPTADRCDLELVEACISLVESAPTCDEAEALAVGELCYSACR